METAGAVHGFSTGGVPLFRYPTGSEYLLASGVGRADGTFYIGDPLGMVHKIDGHGVGHILFEAPRGIQARLSLDPFGQLYVPCMDHSVYVFTISSSRRPPAGQLLRQRLGFSIPARLVEALTPLPGIAERGETCGAVVGSLLAIGFVYGRERLDDWAGWRTCLVPARTFCARFEDELGSTMCGNIVEKLFGRRYNLADPVDLGKFQEAGATAKCTRVVRTTVRIAAEIILDKTQATRVNR
jgi:hypothetical protein